MGFIQRALKGEEFCSKIFLYCSLIPSCLIMIAYGVIMSFEEYFDMRALVIWAGALVLLLIWHIAPYAKMLWKCSSNSNLFFKYFFRLGAVGTLAYCILFLAVMLISVLLNWSDFKGIW